MTVTPAGSQGLSLGGMVSAAPARAWPAQGVGCSARAAGAVAGGAAVAGSRVVPTAFGRAIVPAVPLASARGAAPVAPQLHSARPAALAPASLAPQPLAQAAGAAAQVPQFRAQASDLGVAVALAPPASARGHFRATDFGRSTAQAPPTSARATQSQAALVVSPIQGAALPHRVAPSLSAAPAAVHSPQQHLGSTAAAGLSLGARVEALYEGRWYAGDLAGLPEDDEEQLGRWAVKCDVDPAGVYAYVMDVRPLAGAASAATGAATAAAGTAAAPRQPPQLGRAAAAADSWEPPIPGGGTSGTAWDGDAADVIVTKAFLADGNEYFMVCDPEGNELGSFDATRHLEFELNAGPEHLQRWLQSLSTPLLPGLLALLVEATDDRGKRLAEAKERRDALHSPEDYHFFGLSPDCSDQELERAYRRVCARLHPDKGGDETAFAAMRQRYERLKSLRARGASGGGAGAASAGGAGAADGEAGAEAGGRRGEISWDPRDRASMLQAHEDLRLQLLWIAEQAGKVERDIAELQRRQETTYCLADRPPVGTTAVASADAESGLDAAGVASAVAGSGDYAAASGAHARHDFGTCMLCLERIPADPRLVVNLCSADPPCQCLLHVRCFLDRAQGMNDHLRRCMICRRPADPELVRRAAQARERSLS